MKKLIGLIVAFLITLTNLLTPSAVFAGHCNLGFVHNPANPNICDPVGPNTIRVAGPSQGGYKTIGDFVGNVLTLAFAVALLVALFMLIWGAFEWITSGGDKEAVGKARGRIINALIGLAVLAIAFALARVAATFLGFDLGNIAIPTPNPSPLGF